MYSPKIREDLIPRIHRLAEVRGIPMTRVVDEILRRSLLEEERTSTQEIHEPFGAGEYQAHRVYVQLIRGSERTESLSINSPADVFKLLSPIASNWDREKMVSILMNTRNRVIGIEEVSVGTLTSSVVHPRELFKSAILANATGFILAHNHPSGDPSPSQEDRELTKSLKEAGSFMGINLHDHIILAPDRYVSFLETGLL